MSGPADQLFYQIFRGTPPPLTTRLRRGALDSRVHAQVVERTGENRHRGRTGPAATADGLVIIAALPGGENANDQPDGKKYRADVHAASSGLSALRNEAASNSGQALIVARSRKEAYPGAATPSPEWGAVDGFPEIWKYRQRGPPRQAGPWAGRGAREARRRTLTPAEAQAGTGRPCPPVALIRSHCPASLLRLPCSVASRFLAAGTAFSVVAFVTFPGAEEMMGQWTRKRPSVSARLASRSPGGRSIRLVRLDA